MSDKIIHSVDGIDEADNQLPRWWLYTLYGAIAFGTVYWVWFQVLGNGQTPLAAYRVQKLEAAQAEAAKLRSSGPMTPDKLVEMSHNAAIISSGKATFAATCATCHGANAGGVVGPNLTDKFWLHGGKPEQILATVRGGWPDKGMPAWGPQLGEQRVREVAAYVLTLKNTNVAGGKAAQGEAE